MQRKPHRSRRIRHTPACVRDPGRHYRLAQWFDSPQYCLGCPQRWDNPQYSAICLLLFVVVRMFFLTFIYDSLIVVYPDAEETGLRAQHFKVNPDKVLKFLHDRMKDAHEMMSRYADRTSTFPCGRLCIRSNGSYSYRPQGLETSGKMIGPFRLSCSVRPCPSLYAPQHHSIHPVFH